MIGRSLSLIECLDAVIEQRREARGQASLAALFSLDALRAFESMLSHAIEAGDVDLQDQLDEVADAIAQIEDPQFRHLEAI